MIFPEINAFFEHIHRKNLNGFFPALSFSERSKNSLESRLNMSKHCDLLFTILANKRKLASIQALLKCLLDFLKFECVHK